MFTSITISTSDSCNDTSKELSVAFNCPSFVYILTGLHGLHLFGGMIFLLIVLVATYKYKVHSKNMNQITMCATYWHFLDGLWLYLFIFLLLNR